MIPYEIILYNLFYLYSNLMLIKLLQVWIIHLYTTLPGSGNIGEQGTEKTSELEDRNECCYVLPSCLGMDEAPVNTRLQWLPACWGNFQKP